MRDCPDFEPAWWLPGPHAQTLWGSLCRPYPRPRYHRQRLELPDGDFLDLDWSASTGDPQRPLVLILHGLEGSSRSSYARGLVQELENRGMSAVVLHFRGCSGVPNRLRRTYHSGETSDLTCMARWLRRHWPARPIAAVGISLGGNVLLKYLGERPEDVVLDAAAAACAPMDLAVCATRLERGVSRLYMRHLLRQMKSKTAFKYRRRDSGLDLGSVAGSSGFWDFDDRATARLHGFQDAHDYYQRSSAMAYVTGIRTPTLVVHASDDPFMSDAVLPGPAEVPSSVCLEISASGGHVGFVEGTGVLGLIPRSWLDRRIGDYLQQALGPPA